MSESPAVDFPVIGEIFLQTPPLYLHHYTNFDSALGILRSSTIWASDILTLNDSKEAGHARDVLLHCLENFLTRAGMTESTRFKGIRQTVEELT